MHHSTTVGVDLAKNVIQVSVISARGKELLNRSFTRAKFAEFLGKQKPSLVAFESCASAHYWARAAVALANKNVRTAWAMVAQGTEYQRRLQLEMAA